MSKRPASVDSQANTPGKLYLACQRHARYYYSLLNHINQLYLNGGDAITQGLNLFDLNWHNIKVGQQWATSQTEKADVAAELCSDYADAGMYILSLCQHPDERIRWLESAVTAARRLKEPLFEGRHLGNLGAAHHALGETRRAIDLHEQALIIIREIGDRHGEGYVFNNLGIAYLNLGELRRAVESYEQCFVITREIGDRRGEGAALGNLGLTYAALGELHGAIECYEQYLAIMREIGDRRCEGIALGNLGVAYKKLGDLRRAIELYEQCFVIADETGNQRGESEVLFNMSLALDELGEHERASLCGKVALMIYVQIENPWPENVQDILAEWCGRRNNPYRLRN